MPEQTPFTGRARRKRTPFAVRFTDRIATGLITVGGIGTIAAVCGVCVYLVWMVVPLFQGAELEQAVDVSVAAPLQDPRALQVSETNQLGWLIDADGKIVVLRPDTGEVLSTSAFLAEGETLTSVASSSFSEMLAVGLADGGVRLGRIHFETSFPSAEESDPAWDRLQPGEAMTVGDSIVLRTEQGQFRRESVAIDFEGDPVAVSPSSAIEKLDFTSADAGPTVLTWSADGQARLLTIGRSENVFTGEVELSAGTTAVLPLPRNRPGNRPGNQPPRFVRLGVRGAVAYLAWPDGMTARIDTRDAGSPRLVEQIDLVADPQAELTALEFMVGQITLLVGDSQGRISAWFPARPMSPPVQSEVPTAGAAVEAAAEPGIAEQTGTAGQSGTAGQTGMAGQPGEQEASEQAAVDAPLTEAHLLEESGPAVTALAAAPRSRVAAAGFADGSLRVYQVTLGEQQASGRIGAGSGSGQAGQKSPVVTNLLLSAADEAGSMYAIADGDLYRIPMGVAYHEASLRSFFTPVWYESYPDSGFVWQTSSGTSAAEPKFSLVPLVFGTLKATFYSLLFAVPLAMLAAIYTSEFLTKSGRARIKPVIEVMASLPSVVLGFLAAMVFAPFVGHWLPAVIAAAVTVPLSLLLSAHLWQLLPSMGRRRWEWLRLPLAGLAVILGFGLAALFGPVFEWLFFAGDVKKWLDGQIGSGFAGWMLLWLPVSAVLVVFASVRWVNSAFVRASVNWNRPQAALADMGRFLLLASATATIAAAISGLLTLLGFDPRGSFVDTYVSRNSLVVGFGMGFAIIPLIYTLADDALNAVPEALRSASLGSGATPWQTAVRVVIPTATSGLFSAVMVGLGRAVGETMIVLMAAGNTPIMKLNVFNGFQTLSAAIATEMAEAARGSTHFRVLFLAALVLFLMTFLVNTVAEIVRLRFRRRVVQL